MAKLIIGCGYLGQRVAERWLAQGESVLATTRSEARADQFRGRGIEPIVCDILSPASLGNLPAVASVLYAIGLDRCSGRSMREVYIQGLENVLTALPRPDRLIYISSTSVYGQRRGEEVDEDASTEPADSSGQVMLAAERLLRSRIPEAIVLRFAGIYGPDRFMRRQALLQGEPIAGNPDRWLNLIHVEDGAAAVLAAESHGAPGQNYNVCDGQHVQRRVYYEYLAELFEAAAPRFDSSVASTREGNRRVLNRRLIADLGVTLRYPSYLEGLPASLPSKT